MSRERELLDQHWAIFSAQRRNWNEFNKKVLRLKIVVVLILSVDFVLVLVSLWNFPKISGFLILVLPVVTFVAANITSWRSYLKHRRIDRSLETKKAQIEKDIEGAYVERKEEPPIHAIAIRVRFANPKPQKRQKKGRQVLHWAPWEDFQYAIYWDR